MAQTRQRAGSAPEGTPFDLDRLLAPTERAARAERAAEVTIAAGEMVRRARSACGITQAELARRTESTQPYISEVERGIGPNGPTVATLGRILDELGEELVLKTANEWAATVAQKASEAEEWLNELLATLPPDNPRAAITLISEGLQAAKTDPFKQLLAKGAIIGLRKGISLSAGFYRERFKEMNWASKALVTAAAALSSADDRQKLEESVSLRDERVEVTRRVIERSSPDSAFQERTFEAGQESGSLGTDRDQATAISG